MSWIQFLLLLLCPGANAFNVGKRVIGGVECGEAERLYHVRLKPLKTNGKWGMCGGSLISQSWILTAAHCWLEKDVRAMYVLIDAHPGPATQVHVTTKERYGNHDILLLKLPESLTRIAPVSLPDCSVRPATVQVAGYGATQPDALSQKSGPKSSTLQCANMDVVECSELYSLRKKMYKNQHWFCGKANNIDTCPGDSGGGAVYNQQIYGVHSLGGVEVCKKPSAFLDVCKYLAWIKEKTGLTHQEQYTKARIY